MTKTEDLLLAAFAETVEPSDSGFTQQVASRIDTLERRHRLMLALLMTVAAVLTAAMLVGLFRLEAVWTLLARQNWLALSPTTLDPFSLWAAITGVAGVAVIGVPLVRSRV
jgi:hypothetical protein